MSYFGGHFADAALQFLALFAGVFTVVAGVILMVATIGILVVPYLLMMEEAKIADRRSHVNLKRRSNFEMLPDYR